MKMFSVFAAALLAFSSCASITSMQKRDIVEAKMNGTYVEEKNAGLAAGLNVLPGFGDFYNGNIGYGIVNLLTWPLSVLWAPVGGYDGALVRNWEESRIYAARNSSPQNPQKTSPPTENLSSAEYLCSTHGSYEAGFNDGQLGHSMNAKAALSACGPQTSKYTDSYKKGYLEGKKNSKPQTSTQEKNVIITAAATTSATAKTCLEAYGKKECGYDCKKAYGNVACATNPEDNCVASYGKLRCGFQCEAKFGDIKCGNEQ